MQLDFYHDQTRVNYIGVGFTVEPIRWYWEMWTIFPYILVWFSMCRMLVRRDMSSILFYVGLMINEYFGYVLSVSWVFSIMSHYIFFTASTLLGSLVCRSTERVCGLFLTMVGLFLILISKSMSTSGYLVDFGAGVWLGGATGILWCIASRLLQECAVWNHLFADQSTWNCLMIRHTKGISQKTLFDYYLTQELNMRRHNIMNSPSKA